MGGVLTTKLTSNDTAIAFLDLHIKITAEN